MAGRRRQILLLSMCVSWAFASEAVCKAGEACREAEVDIFDESAKMSDLSLMLLQRSSKNDLQVEQVPVATGASMPFWCVQLDPWTQATIPTCVAGGCTCMGPTVCGEGPALPGSWQSYSYSCCGCGGVAAPHKASVAGALCSAHPACSKLGITGDCCPTAASAMLGCCEQHVGAPSPAPASEPPHPPPHPPQATPPAAVPAAQAAPVVIAGSPSGTAIPHWCYDVAPASRPSIPACMGGGPTMGGCDCLGVTVCAVAGPPVPGSWQSYSSSCCGCK
ncbi:unnamed protein product [Polarella glacialis]|uniref:Uncharacterized protein n=1 Tax=Polarella glacialis TaxID=89957 RepID=A0A813DI99_POLGL|nr:unnamed protein product [Polarella glacialis]|mmetsp:Transcript_16404/g.29133  ORF Transcript_16404/g.29133 Transcript_16404/m.29133 type:complete len:277 (+) Transcript_16404:74-904(+)